MGMIALGGDSERPTLTESFIAAADESTSRWPIYRLAVPTGFCFPAWKQAEAVIENVWRSTARTLMVCTRFMCRSQCWVGTLIRSHSWLIPQPAWDELTFIHLLNEAFGSFHLWSLV